MTLRMRYDPATDAAYLRFSTSKVAESDEVAPGIVLDYDAAGHIVGLEVLQASSQLPKDALAAAE